MVKRTRNGGTWTESQYWSAVKSALRKRFAYWLPAMEAKRKARRPYCGPNKRRHWEYQCAHCQKWYADKEVELHHLIPVGSLKGPDDISLVLQRLTPENPEAYAVLCEACHQKETHKE